MRALYCAAGLLVSFACAYGEESPPIQTLTILFQFQRPYTDRAFLEAQREANILIKGAGVKLDWFDRESPQARLSFPSIVVMDFVGNCDLRSANTFAGPVQGWLARMQVSDGVVLPFGEVNCDLVRALLTSQKQKGLSKDVVFGRALARVLAHELYHFISQDTGHSSGLAKPSFSREDLVLNSLKLDRHELDRLSRMLLLP